MFDFAELDDFAVGGGEDGIGVGVEWTYSRLECTVEEFGKVGVVVKVGICYF